MRRLLLLLGLLILLAGCGGDDEPAGGGQGSASTAPAADAFPVTLEHRYGETTIESAPERVAVVGLREVDDVLALGVVPVLTTRYIGVDEGEGGIRPWARPLLRGATEPRAINTTDGIPVEQVAASRPDLIIGRFSGMTQDEYDQLSRIAPVVAQPEQYPDYGEPWQEEMRAVGEALGRADEAQSRVERTEGLIADAREEHPEFEGATGVFASPFQGVYVYGPDDSRGRLLSDLGFRAPEGIEAIIGDQFGAQLPDERTDLLDVDALVWLVESAAQRREVDAKPVYSRLGVADRAIFATPDDVIYNASSATTVLSIPPVLEELVPRLAEAVGAAG